MPSSRSQYVAAHSEGFAEVAFRLTDWPDGTPVGVTVTIRTLEDELLGATSLRTSVKKSWQYFALVPLTGTLTDKVSVTVSAFSADAPPTV